MAARTIRAGVVGFGWMGQAHARSLLRGPTIFQNAPYRVHLVAIADTDPARRQLAVDNFGAHRAHADWRDLLASDEIDAVWVTAPKPVSMAHPNRAAVSNGTWSSTTTTEFRSTTVWVANPETPRW